jgi:hypothetical protein
MNPLYKDVPLMEKDNAPLDTDDIKDRLFEIISSMADVERRDLLEVLEIMHASKPTERRENQRKSPATNTGFLMHEVVLKDCIQNISQTGAFIETAHSCGVGQRLSMAIHLAGNENPIQLNGTIVRVDAGGVAVEFDEAISDI